MRPSILIYPILTSLLMGLFYFYTPDGGTRLPIYYTPEGHILPLGSGIQTKSYMVKKINNKTPHESPLIFKSFKTINLVTDKGQFFVKPIKNNRWKILYDFKIIVVFSFISLFTAIWVFTLTRDLLIGILCLVQTLFSFCSYLVVVGHELNHLWIFSSVAMGPALLNVGLRTTGKETPAYLLVAEIILCLFFTLISFVGRESISTLQNLTIMNISLFFSALVITLALQIQNVLRSTVDQVDKYKRKILLFGTTAGIALPATLFTLSYIWREHFLPVDIMLIPGIIFPVTLIYSTYRLHFVKFQLILTRSLMAGVLTITLVGIYGVVLLTYNMLLPEQGGGYSWIVNIVFILILVFFLDPVRRYISNMIEKRVYRLDTKLMDSLKRLADALAYHSRVQPTAGAYLQEIQETLRLEKISFLFSAESFPGLNIKTGKLLRIPADNKIWKYLQPGLLRVATYLSYAGGGRGELFRFLFKNEYLLGLGIAGDGGRVLTPANFSSKMESSALTTDMGLKQNEQIKAALMVGYRKDKSKLKLKEIRYLQEAAKLAGLLIYNYALLIQEVAKRRRIRELNLAGLVQRSLPGPAAEEFDHINMSYINKPATSVTGDYLDIITLSPEKFAFMIGDVSGHGLGTGYIVSVARSIIRSHLKAGLPLIETIDNLNSFLVDRYQGGEFITLFIGILDAKTGNLEFINAAHPGPLIRRVDGSFQELVSTQRLIGVLPTVYHSDVEILHPKDRIFVFSDGVIETFDDYDVAFGDQRLRILLERFGGNEIPEIVSIVDKELNDFRSNKPLTDDTTFVAIEFTPQRGLLQNILTLIGIGKK